MIASKSSRNFAAISIIGALLGIFTLFLPWVFVPIDVHMQRDGVPELEHAALLKLMAPLSTIETGISGRIGLGIPFPAWLFILLIPIAGVVSGLSIVGFFEVSYKIVFVLLVVSIVPLSLWVLRAVSAGSSYQSGAPVALVAVTLIFVATIKSRQLERKSNFALDD